MTTTQAPDSPTDGSTVWIRRNGWRLAAWVLGAVVWSWIDWAGRALPDEERFRLLPMLRGLPEALSRPAPFATVGMVLVIAVLVSLRKRASTLSRLPTAPLIPVLALFPLLFLVQASLDAGNLRNLLRAYLVVIAGSLSLALALGPALAGLRPRPSVPLIIVLVLAAVYALLWSHWTLHRHAVFGSAAWDLGYIESALWNTTRGRLFQSTVISIPCRNILGDHFIPIVILVLPFYILGGRSPESLLVVQSVWLASGAIPLFLIARRRWEDPIAAVFLAGTYLLYPALHIVNVFDFHSVALAVPLLFWAFYYLEREIWFNFGLCLFLACLCKEEIPLLGVFLGIYLLAARRRRLPGLITVLACGAMFWFAIRVWLPTFSGRQDFWPIVRYADLGDTIGEAVGTIFTRPIYTLGVALERPKLEFLLRLLAPLLFLPLSSPGPWIFVLPAVGVCILSSVPDMYSMADHHVSGSIATLMLAAILGLHTLSRRLAGRVTPSSLFRVAALAALLCASWIARIQWQSSVYGRLEPLKEPYDAHVAAGHRLIAMVPPEATVETQNHLVPHLSHRDRIWVFPEGNGQADYLLFDLSDHGGRGRKTYPLGPQEFEDRIRAILASGIYGKAVYENGFLLLRKNSEDKDFRDVLGLLEGGKA